MSGRGVTGDEIVMHERPPLPIVRNTVLLSATQAVHSAMLQLSAAASITLVRVLSACCCAVGLPRRSWQPKQASA